jgi:hypothetical protein
MLDPDPDSMNRIRNTEKIKLRTKPDKFCQSLVLALYYTNRCSGSKYEAGKIPDQDTRYKGMQMKYRTDTQKDAV